LRRAKIILAQMQALDIDPDALKSGYYLTPGSALASLNVSNATMLETKTTAS